MRLEGATAGQAALIETVEKSLPAEEPPRAPARRASSAGSAGVGEATAGGVATFVEILSFFGADHRPPRAAW